MFPKLVKEIRSKAGELHFRRWRIVETPILRIYIHHILKADEDLHAHSHPWSFFSLVLNGGYWENIVGARIHRLPGSVVHRHANDFHKVDAIDATVAPQQGCWTLVVAYGRRQEWGYKVDGIRDGYDFMQHEEYRTAKNSGTLKGADGKAISN